MATFLAGGIAEANYLFAAAGAVLLHLSLQAAHGVAYLPGLAILALPITANQTTLVAGELALLAALLLNALPGGAGRPTVEITTEEHTVRSGQMEQQTPITQQRPTPRDGSVVGCSGPISSYYYRDRWRR